MVGFIFPGQGSQYVGMGKDLHKGSKKARTLFERANEVLGFEVKDILFNGPDETLRESRNAQVAILLHSIVCFEIMRDEGMSPACVSGHSLGEYSALYAAGTLSFEDVLHLVRFRGEIMTHAGDENPGTMCAVIGLASEKLEEIIKNIGGVVIANYNSPLQTVISGRLDAVALASHKAEESGAKRTIKLNVSGAFHSPLMESAFDKFGRVLLKIEFRKPTIPVALNVTGKFAEDTSEIRDALARQIISPVRWVDCVMAMRNYGVRQFVEVGPGRVLGNLVRKILPDAEIKNVQGIGDMV